MTLQITTGSVTEGDGATFVCKYTTFAVGDTLTAVTATSGTDLDTTLDEFEVPDDATSHDLNESSRGVIDGGSLTKEVA